MTSASEEMTVPTKRAMRVKDHETENPNKSQMKHCRNDL